MEEVDVVVIGGSQAGLSMSYHLTLRGVSHLVLERGSAGHRWKHERWPSLTLLSPNWQSCLPGFTPRPHQPDGYMSGAEFGAALGQYAASFGAPLREGVEVTRVNTDPQGPFRFVIETKSGHFRANSVVVATGQCAHPRIPEAAAQLLPSTIHQIHSSEYRRSRDLPGGGVLVVGASATGLQLAEELRSAGRKVLLSVGSHTRMPRSYRNRDIMHWLEASGIMNDRAGNVSNLELKRHAPSMQLLGSLERRDINLQLLEEQGVVMAGSLARASGARVVFRDDLEKHIEESEDRLNRVLSRIDDHIDADGRPPASTRSFRPPRIQLSPGLLSCDLKAEGINTVLWATGYRADLNWLQIEGATDEDGEALHQGGVSGEPGLYFLGMNFLRHRNSNTIRGVGRDARFLSTLVAFELGKGRTNAA